jgi:serine/threonine protein kinase
MELVTGGELSQYTTPDKLLPVADVLQIGFKCCGALNYAFNEGIVHRDIKPANIMIGEGTDVKISDFGAALLKKTQAVQTAVMGSPYYMSPEQIEERELTHHSDMYCLAVVLYELLTGRKPFTAPSLPELAQKILLEAPVPPSAIRKDLPKVIDTVILRALGKKPDHRYKTWAEFEVDLSNACKLVSGPDAIPDSEKFVALKGVALLAALSDAELWELAKAGQWKRMAPAKPIIKENDPGQSFFFLGSGQVKVTRQGRLLNIIDKRECFGEMAYIRGGELPRHATVESMTDVLLAEFDPVTLGKISLGAQLQLMRALVRNLVDRLELANTRLAR